MNYSEKINSALSLTWHDALYLPKINCYAIPTEAQKSAISKMSGNLVPIEAHYNKKIIVHSWLRPEFYNKMIGGARMSYHIKGMAIDFHIEGESVDAVKKLLISNKELWPYRGEIDTTNWIHLDMGEGPWFKARS